LRASVGATIEQPPAEGGAAKILSALPTSKVERWRAAGARERVQLECPEQIVAALDEACGRVAR
jgi:hypothetical protein